MPSDYAVTTISRIIQLSVAPVFLLTGIASVLVVLTNRLSRIVDRSRYLREQMKAASQEPVKDYQNEHQVLVRRIKINNVAIGLSIGSALLICSVIALLFLGSLFSARLETIVAVVFITSMIALITALSCLLAEVYLATVAFRHEW